MDDKLEVGDEVEFTGESDRKTYLLHKGTVLSFDGSDITVEWSEDYLGFYPVHILRKVS